MALRHRQVLLQQHRGVCYREESMSPGPGPGLNTTAVCSLCQCTYLYCNCHYQICPRHPGCNSDHAARHRLINPRHEVLISTRMAQLERQQQANNWWFQQQSVAPRRNLIGLDIVAGRIASQPLVIIPRTHQQPIVELAMVRSIVHCEDLQKMPPSSCLYFMCFSVSYKCKKAYCGEVFHVCVCVCLCLYVYVCKC
ncbi:unnamed protein product [Gongylonema pulchrum]|uniref:MYND-type domain-containing protein n=1 Tax=Gongylonema pulchrum TaxID=637853 RepID=A0A183EPQ5_9BILA|nr:unnamed protein product [Gongylonema pulchrum]